MHFFIPGTPIHVPFQRVCPRKIKMCPSLKATVNSMFRKKLGTTVQQEIAQARIETAKRLLKETDLKIAQVASESGFGSVEYFCNCFAQACGCSPSEFRT